MTGRLVLLMIIQLFSEIFVVTGSFIPVSPYYAGCQFLGPDSSRAQVIVFNSATCNHLYVAGAVAVGSAFTYNPAANVHGTIGIASSQGTLCLNPFGLYANGALTASRIIDVYGRIHILSLSAGSTAPVAGVAGCSDATGTAPTNWVGTLSSSTANYVALSTKLAALALTGSYNSGTGVLTGSNNPTFEVFSIQSLTTNVSFSFSNVASSAFVIINVQNGGSVTMSGSTTSSLVTVLTASKILWHFPNAGSISLVNAANQLFHGTIFAPSASFADNTGINGQNANTYLDGQLIVSSITGGRIHVGGYLGIATPQNTLFEFCTVSALVTQQQYTTCASSFVNRSSGSGQITFTPPLEPTFSLTLDSATVSFVRVNNDPLAKLVVNAEFSSLSNVPQLLSNSLTLHAEFLNYGVKANTSLQPGYTAADVRADWFYFIFQSGYVENLGIEVRAPRSGVKLLIMGTNAAGANTDYGLYFTLEYVLPGTTEWVSYAEVKILLKSSCTCAWTSAVGNYDFTTGNGGGNGFEFTGKRYTKDPMKYINFDVMSGTAYGIDPVIRNTFPFHDQSLIHVTARITPDLSTIPNNVANYIDVDLWLLGTTSNAHGTLSASQTTNFHRYSNWRTFTLIRGTMDDRTKSYVLFNITQSQNVQLGNGTLVDVSSPNYGLQLVGQGQQYSANGVATPFAITTRFSIANPVC